VFWFVLGGSCWGFWFWLEFFPLVLVFSLVSQYPGSLKKKPLYGYFAFYKSKVISLSSIFFCLLADI
jgi:hypothetical protein